MARRTGRQVERQWQEWLEGLKPDQIEHVLLSLTDERQALNDKLRRIRADPSTSSGQALGKQVLERAFVNRRIVKARRRLAQLADRR